MKSFLLLLVTAFQLSVAFTQSCTPQGNQTSYGTNNVWIGYVYDNSNLTNYRGYVNEGNSSNPNFNQNFGGDNVNYATNGCPVQTETFSVRYRLTKTFTPGNYQFVVGGDDGYRFSLDGGNTWVINNWNDHGYATTTYTTFLDGTYNMVLEYYENGGANRVSFNLSTICSGTENTNVYGTNNVWNAYVYDGINFDTYHGMVNVGTAASPNFDINFGGNDVMYNTSGCSVQTETFSVRYRLRKNFPNGTYQFTIGGDDGYRLSIDGGATWFVNRWVLQTYAATASNTVTLNGDYDLVLEYYENTGANRISFSMQQLTILPVSLESFSANVKNNNIYLDWAVSNNSNPKTFEVERSTTGSNFESLTVVAPQANTLKFNYIDATATENIYYYRLKITDQTGIVTYSKIEKIFIQGTNTNLSVYPTVVNSNSFNVKVGNAFKNMQVTVSDISGRPIFQQKIGNVNSGQIVQVTDSRIAANKGVLFVTIQSSDGHSTTQRILVH